MPLRDLLATLLVMGNLATAERIPPAEQPPRKITVATVMAGFNGSADERATAIAKLIAEARVAAQPQRLDLLVLPEYALQRPGTLVRDRALAIDDPAVRAVGEAARAADAWVVLPLILREDASCANAAVLLDRAGMVAGVYRKAHPIVEADGSFEGGVTPGRAYPVFTTDFGRLGIQICWDMAHEKGWKALAAAGAELVALPSASPQSVRPASYAQRFRYWVVSATPRDNVSVYDPLGLVAARREQPGVLLHRFDLSAAVVHWNPRIEEGRAFTRAFPARGGFRWSAREDTGLFWSDDPAMTIGAMLRQLQVETMDAQVARIAAELARTAPAP